MQKANGFTRQEILNAIKLNGTMTAEALGKALNISPVAVRQHLAALEAEGLVATSIERRNVGRPVHRYTITHRGDETFPRDYAACANSLLDEIRYREGEEAVAELFTRQRERLQSSLQSRMDGKSLAARVCELAKIQSDAGYMAKVVEEEHGEGYILTEHNCAICQIARQHPEACEQELILFQQLLGEDVEVTREKHILSGDFTCTYRICPR